MHTFRESEVPYLFERLSVRPVGNDGRQEAFDETAAIMAQLQRIVATSRHADDNVAAVQWGLRSVVEIGTHASVALERYARQLAEAIARHEPRLKSVHVAVEPEPAENLPESSLSPYRLVVSAVFPGETQARNVRVALPN